MKTLSNVLCVIGIAVLFPTIAIPRTQANPSSMGDYKNIEHDWTDANGNREHDVGETNWSVQWYWGFEPTGAKVQINEDIYPSGGPGPGPWYYENPNGGGNPLCPCQ